MNELIQKIFIAYGFDEKWHDDGIEFYSAEGEDKTSFFLINYIDTIYEGITDTTLLTKLKQLEKDYIDENTDGKGLKKKIQQLFINNAGIAAQIDKNISAIYLIKLESINNLDRYRNLIDHNKHKVAYSDSITYGIFQENIPTENLDDCIEEYSDWRESINSFNVIQYSKENFAVYYYISQAESVHFLKQSITQRKDAMNVLLDLGEVDSWVTFLQDRLIGKTTASPNVVINDKIKSLDTKINEDIDQLKAIGAVDELDKEQEFFHIIQFEETDNIPLWDYEKLESVNISELEKGVRDIDRISCFVKDQEDYKNYLWNKKLETVIASGTDDYILCRGYIENERVDIDKIKQTIEIKNHTIEVFNNSTFLREKEIIPKKYSIEGMTKLKQLLPECVLFDIEEVGSECAKLVELNKTLSSKQAVIKKLENARLALLEANQEWNKNGDKCPYCGHSYGESQRLKEAYEAAHTLLEAEKGEELFNYNEVVKKLGEKIKESKDKLDKELGNISETDITTMLYEIKQLSSFVSDKKRVESVEMLIPFAKVDKAFENMGKQEQKMELQRMFIATKKSFANENFTTNLTSFDYEALVKEYPAIKWTEQRRILDEQMIDSKKSYIKSAINKKKNEKANEINNRIKENVRKWQCLKKIREELKNIQTIYSEAIEAYTNQVLKKLRVPLLIYTGKILQDYQNGLGVFISKNEMRFVTNGDVKHDILNMFSSGQLSGFVLAFLFSMNKLYVKESEDDLGFILIDDPVQTMDDINISSMVEVLRNDFKDKQIILSTHETDKENFILYKFFKYNKIGQSFNVKDQLYGV